MNKVICFILTIILDTPSFLYGQALGTKGELLLESDSRETMSNLRTSRGHIWPEENDEIRYSHGYVKNVNEHPRSRLMSSLKNDFKKFEKPQDPEIQSTLQSQPEDSLLQIEQKQQQQHQTIKFDIQGREPYEEQREKKDRETNEDEKNKDWQEEKFPKSEVNLFGSQLQVTLEQLEARDLQKTREKYLNVEIVTDDSPKISRVDTAGGNHFSYFHPEEWALNNPECSGRLQSPVNLDSDKLVGLNLPSSLIWTGYWNRPRNMTVMDNGHSVELSGVWDANTVPFIRGGPLDGDYLFAQLHFHWGPKNSVGSEHTINNKSFPMEMHMVHYKRDYQTFKKALKHDDGLAVIAFLFEISDASNLGINLLEDTLSKISNKPRIGIPVRPYPLAFLHSMFQEDYASYIGSLTTPPCREIVTWLVSSIPLSISRRQLEYFRNVSNKWPEKENYRPRQALNGRRLYYVRH